MAESRKICICILNNDPYFLSNHSLLTPFSKLDIWMLSIYYCWRYCICRTETSDYKYFFHHNVDFSKSTHHSNSVVTFLYTMYVISYINILYNIYSIGIHICIYICIYRPIYIYIIASPQRYFKKKYIYRLYRPIYIYIYTYIYTYIYLYIYKNRFSSEILYQI